jgi:hypothetical protein
MKKPIFVAILACIVLFVAGCDFFDDDDDGGWYGNGSAGNYNIGTVAQLIQLAEIVNGTYKSGDVTLPADDFNGKTVTLTADINLNNQEWKRIGTERRTFNGTFDGYNKTISNLNITNGRSLFYEIGEHGTVKNIVFTNLNISANSLSSSLIRENNGKIKNISIINGSVKNGTAAGAGIVENNRGYGIVENCNFSGNVSASYSAGGIVQYNSANAVIRNCYVTGAVTTSGNSGTGGIVGSNSGTVKNCYTTCSVTGGTLIGHNIGGIAGDNIGTVENCYATGDISGTNWIGGVVGKNSSTLKSGTIKNCYATGNVTGESLLGGITGRDGRVQNCVALNPSIKSTKKNSSIGRISAYSQNLNNYALNGMTLVGSSNVTAKSDANGIHGADIEASDYNSQGWWTNKSNWDSEYWDFTNVWEWDDDENLPKLRVKDF